VVGSDTGNPKAQDVDELDNFDGSVPWPRRIPGRASNAINGCMHSGNSMD